MLKFVRSKLHAKHSNTTSVYKYAHQQILFFKLIFNVKLIYSIQVLGPWLFLQWWGRGRGLVGKMPHQSMVLKKALTAIILIANKPDRCMCIYPLHRPVLISRHIYFTPHISHLLISLFMIYYCFMTHFNILTI